MKHIAVILLLCMGAIGIAHSQLLGDEDGTARQLRIENLIARVPEGKAIELREAFRDPAKAKETQQKLVRMIQAKEAELVDWPIVTTLSGNRAVSENIQEIRYPIEFEPPRILKVPIFYPSSIIPIPVAPEPVKEEGGEGKKEPAEIGRVEVQTLGGVPSTFETRNAGVTLETEAVTGVGPADSISMQLAPQRVSLAGFRKKIIESGGAKVSVEVPEFHTSKVSTNIRVQSGVPMLMGFYKVPDRKDVIELSVVTATIVQVKPETRSRR